MTNLEKTLFGSVSLHRERKAFGDDFMGPDKVPQRTPTVIAQYVPTSPDGERVEVSVTAHPARFYILTILHEDGSRTNVYTGSGGEMLNLVRDMAEAIADGMIDIEKEESQ